MYIRPETRLAIVQYYLKNNTTLMQTASKFHVNYRTVFKWVKAYKEEGERRLLGIYTRPRSRTEGELEERIALLKEREPALTVRKAKEILEKQGIEISIKGVWRVWSRYGYVALKKESYSLEFADYISGTPEAKYVLEEARRYVELNNLQKAGKILNEMPSCPKNEILTNIPDKFLAPCRRLEKYYSLFGKIPYNLLSQKLMKLRRNFESRGYVYSAIRTGLLEALCYAGSGKIKRELVLLGHMRKLCPEENLDPAVRFSIYCIKGIAYARSLEVQKAVDLLRKCEYLIKKYPTSNFVRNFLIFCDNLGYFQKFDRILKVYENKFNEDDVLFLKSRLYITQGEYEKYNTLMQRLKNKEEKTNPSYVLQRAQYFLVQKGDIFKAMNQMQLFLEIVKKMELRIYWGFATFFLAVIHSAQGQRNKAIILLKRYLPLLKRYGNKKDLLLYETIINNPKVSEDIKQIHQNYLLFLLKKSSLSLKTSDYKKAYKYAEKAGLLGILHRVSILFPEIIQLLIEKGIATGLPKSLLRFPVFNKKTLIYNLKLLGHFAVHKNQKYLKVRLRPKDAAFLIYLSQKAMEPKKAINLEEVYKNFWPGSETASRNFSHLLVRIKKALKIPTHLLIVSWGYGEPVLINEGIYFTTDLQEFEQTLAQAKALERAGEWGFAKKEYLRAFRLFRGEPFKKNFDDWSVNMRFKILSQLETEAVNFAKSCLEHRNKTDARRVLQNVLKIIPDSEEIQKLLDGLMGG